VSAKQQRATVMWAQVFNPCNNEEMYAIIVFILTTYTKNKIQFCKFFINFSVTFE